MSRLTTRLMATLTLVMCVVLPLRAQIIVDPPVADWILSPGNAAAGAEFELSVLSYRYTCATRFANQKVVVNEGRIDLSFTSATDALILCPPVVKPFGPAFKMPALKAGKYAVFMNLLLPCHVQQPMCRAAIPVEEAGTLIVTEAGKITYFINPTSVEAETDFTLELLSPQFTCNLEYLRTASRVQDGRITLTFLDKANPLIRCIPTRNAYGPAYKLQGLKAGSYEVWAERLPACVEQGCKILPVPELVAKLTVTPKQTTRKGWFLKSREAKASTPFDLQVVNNAYGNCNTSFDHTSVVVQDGKINVSFVIVSHPERVCIVDLRPHGPSFAMQGMKPGRYPVFVREMPACLYGNPVCLLPVPDWSRIEASDTLIVVQTLSLGGPSAPSGTGTLASWQGGALSLSLPAGATGIWGVDVLSLGGRTLHKGQVAAGNGAALLGFRKPERGMVLVRMTSPALETHTVKVPVQD